jgi:hypothetical protein
MHERRHNEGNNFYSGYNLGGFNAHLPPISGILGGNLSHRLWYTRIG